MSPSPADTPPAAPYLAIFDHDGVWSTLDFTRKPGSSSAAHGLPFTPEFIRETFGMTNPSIFARSWATLSAGRDRLLAELKESATATWRGARSC